MSGDKSVRDFRSQKNGGLNTASETKPDQGNVLPEKQGVKFRRRRQREYRLYVHRGLDGRIRSLSTRTPEDDESRMALFFIIEGVIIFGIVMIFKFFVY